MNKSASNLDNTEPVTSEYEAPSADEAPCAYEAPCLLKYGTLMELTQNGSGGAPEPLPFLPGATDAPSV